MMIKTKSQKTMATDKKSAVSRQHDIKQSTILLIEDEPMLTDIYRLAFSRAPFEFLVATNKEEAIELLFSHKPAVVLLDLVIPMSGDLIIEYEHPVGFDILELLKKSDVTHNAHVFILSNLDTDDYRLQAKQLGADRFYLKTDTSPHQLVDEVTKFLK